VRLDKLLSNSGFGTRSEVKKLLKAGVVAVDDAVQKDGKLQVDAIAQVITVDGEVLLYEEFVYFMMNKPQGYISATEDKHLPTVIDLLMEQDNSKKPFPVGRLDRDTEGLLLLTNDGQLAHQLLSPKKHVPKTYFARIDGEVMDSDVQKFRQGVILGDGYLTKPAELKILVSGDISEIELVITEGKFHQVKRMFEAVGKKVIYLKRIAMGALQLDLALSLGDYRRLTENEVELLRGK